MKKLTLRNRIESVALASAAALFLLTSCGGAGNEGLSTGDAANTAAPDAQESLRTVPPNPKEIVNSDGVIISHAISLRSEPKYPADFEHFDYVNPDAPKGGTLVMAATGTFDSFHRYAQRGDTAPSSEAFYDSLMTASADEIEVYYGLIAEKVEYPPEYDWIIFHLRPEARFQDGKRITAQDVVFSFNKFFNDGVSQFRMYYEPVTSVEALDESRVKFTLAAGDKEMLIGLGGLTILPPQYWEGRDFTEPSTDIPLGSGAYTVSDYSMGQYVTYERLKDYWAMDIPVIKGTLNFDYIRYDMYRDSAVQLEALKAGEVDLRIENSSKQWATGYTGPNFDQGYIIKREIPHEIPPGLQAFSFNTEREVFADRLVRKALSYAMDFEWMNRNLFYDQYQRSRSYFQSTPFEAMGLPSEEELEILEPIRDQIPKEVFTSEYQPPKTDGSGQIREQITIAKQLLKEAGWEIRDQRMVNVETGEPMEFELLIYSTTWERVGIPLKENLEKMGITMNIRLVDTTQYLNRYRDGDYDMLVGSYGGGFFPDSSLQIEWQSEFIDSTYNTSRVQDEAVDYLVDGIIAHQDDNQTLLYWGRALDRVLQWNHYSIPQWHINAFRVAYWDKFVLPEVRPKYGLGTETWWIDPEKAAALPQSR